jgi:hypothetical protein
MEEAFSIDRTDLIERGAQALGLGFAAAHPVHHC